MTITFAPTATSANDVDRHAFNAAFHDLGLVWYWDIDTYESLCRQAGNAAARVRHYLTTAQPHLLKAYDADFLVDRIVTRMTEIRGNGIGRKPHAMAFDRAETCRGVVGF